MSLYCVYEMRPAHIQAIASLLREGDRAEIEATGLLPKKAIWESYRVSHIRKAVLVEDGIAAVWGCSGGMLSPVGHPWLMTTPFIEDIAVSFVREAKKEVAAMLELHPKLSNYVAARYSRALRFLNAIGFSIGDESEALYVGPKRELFLPFHMERDA